VFIHSGSCFFDGKESSRVLGRLSSLEKISHLLFVGEENILPRNSADTEKNAFRFEPEKLKVSVKKEYGESRESLIKDPIRQCSRSFHVFFPPLDFGLIGCWLID